VRVSRLLVLALAAAVLAVATGAVWLSRSDRPSTPGPGELVSFSVSLSGEPSERDYHAHVPADLGAGAPVVLFLHGSGGSGPQIATSPADFQGLADRHGFVAVFPSGVVGTSSEGVTGGWWNAGQCIDPQPRPCELLPRTPLRSQIAAIDDVAYLSAVIDDVARRHRTDPARVYAWGHSLGGFMAQRLACDLADRIAAVVSVAGALTRNPCTPSRPVSVLMCQTLDDTATPTNGNELNAAVADTVSAWQTINGCAEPQTVELTAKVTSNVATCERGAVVEYVVLDEGGHDWIHTAAPVFDWSSHMWRFLEEHPIR
jgi:polyhydroxybutyrate depolymerase